MAASMKLIFQTAVIRAYLTRKCLATPQILSCTKQHYCSNGDEGKSKLNLAKPGKVNTNRGAVKESSAVIDEPQLDNEIVEAAKSIAEAVKGEQRENVTSDLLTKLKEQSNLTKLQKDGKKSVKVGSLLNTLQQSKEEAKYRIRERKHRGEDQFKDGEAKYRGCERKYGNFSQSKDGEEKNSVWESKYGDLDQSKDGESKYRDSERKKGNFPRSKDGEGKYKDRERSYRDVGDRYRGQNAGNGPRKQPPKFNIRSKIDRSKPQLFEHGSLNIFTRPVTEEYKQLAVSDQEISLFDMLEREEYDQLMTPKPLNAYEEEILLTQQGKMWKFPIDNEEGMEDEMSVGFHEHIILDHLLEGMPTSGPVRHFMDLVTVGLSKNPYITAEQKREHVQWFKDYFKDKYHLLDEVEKVDAKGKTIEL